MCHHLADFHLFSVQKTIHPKLQHEKQNQILRLITRKQNITTDHFYLRAIIRLISVVIIHFSFVRQLIVFVNLSSKLRKSILIKFVAFQTYKCSSFSFMCSFIIFECFSFLKINRRKLTSTKKNESIYLC